MVHKKFNKVFGLGLSRTGTTSLSHAFSALGLESLHFSLELFVHPEIIKGKPHFFPNKKNIFFYNTLIKNELKKLDPEFSMDRYDVFCDLPIPLYYKELDHKFPGSKFIYTYRNEEKWLASMKWLFEEGAVMWEHGLLEEELHLAVYGCKQYDEPTLRKKFREYHTEITTYFANRENDFLSISLDDKSLDMALLSSFLEIPVSSGLAFPKSNSARKASKKAHLNHWLSKKIAVYKILRFKSN